MRSQARQSGRWHEINERIKANIRKEWRVQEVDGYIEGPCHIWQRADSGNGRGGGYPRMKLDGQTVAVHRVAYTQRNGYVPGKKQIDHKCRQRLCVNPDHLEMVTHKKNQKRRAAAANGQGAHPANF